MFKVGINEKVANKYKEYNDAEYIIFMHSLWKQRYKDATEKPSVLYVLWAWIYKVGTSLCWTKALTSLQS